MRVLLASVCRGQGAEIMGVQRTLGWVFLKVVAERHSLLLEVSPSVGGLSLVPGRKPNKMW